MATTRENLFNKLGGSFWNAGVTFERTNPVPLEKYSVFQTLEEAQTYARDNVVAYPGQPVAVVGETMTTIYYIDTDGSLKPFATGGSTAEVLGELEAAKKALSNDYTTRDTTLSNDLTGVVNTVSVALSTDYTKKIDDLSGVYVKQTTYNELTADLPNRYLSVSVANSPSASDKLMKESEVKAKINALDVATQTLAASKTIKSIGEEDGKISVEIQDIQISKAQVTDLTSDLNSLTADVVGLKTVSADHETRLTAAEGDIDALQTDVAGLKTASADFEARITNNANAITAEVQNRENAITALSSTVASTYLSASTFKTLSNDIGLSAASKTNPVVTKSDIADLAGAMHFVGAATLSAADEDAKACLVRTFADAKKGDVAIIVSTSKEYVYVSDTAGQTTGWVELGDESLYATKAELETETTNRTQGDADTLTAAQAYANTISTALSTDYAAKIDTEEKARKADDQFLSGQITAITSDVDTKYNALTANDNFLSGKIGEITADLTSYAKQTALTAEEDARKTADTALSTAIDSKVKIDEVSAATLNVKHVSGQDYHNLVKSGTLDNSTLYIVSSDTFSAYDEKIVNVAAPTENTDAANKKYVDDEVKKISDLADTGISAITLNGQVFTTENHAATLTIDVIDCGDSTSTTAS